METQKKGVMYVYKLATGNPTPEIESPVKNPVVPPRGYWGLRKSKTCRESDRSGGQRVVDGGGDDDDKVVEVMRKSVSFTGRKSVSAVGRKSVSHVETNSAAMAAFLQVKVLVTDMPGFMQVHAFRCARTSMDSLEKFSSKHIAHNLKKEFDKVYGPAWHCIVGSSFGSFVTHSTGCFLYFSIEKLYVLIFKTKVQKASD